ncbi:probable sodium/metabolite cotransporter BASS4, chloroplastic isoform X2 [Vitis riparia]|uniref:probable sodium/metabolite cotransporter BASS4, chloroplastic isoform X2 n=1 Tax=Vitis riparia TaxID=96939 RepID=UPI00155ACFE2|nr:probable sodium/metabolite cotransporter BASS4, chloroplastic isoform X2 [Vitis riparia]
MAAIIQTLILRPPHPITLPHPTPITSNAIRFCISTHKCSLLLWKPRSVSKSFPITAAQHSAQGDDASQATSSGKALTWAKPLLSFVADNFLPLALVSGVALGLANPTLGCLADRYSLSKVSTFGIFIISGLMLRSGEIGAAAEAWPVGIFGLGSILLFTPLFSRLILQFQLQPQEFITGLAIFSCMPTTLSSGVALTQLAGGNSALALAMTVISNLLGILIVLRESFKGVADFVDKNRKLLSMISAIFLSLVPWIQVSRSRSLLLMVKPAVFLVAIGMGTVLHLVLLAFNALSIQSLSAVSGGSKSPFAKRQNTVAFLLVASQKTLPVMVAVVEQLHGTLGESGLLVLPCVAAHLNQIIMDSFLINIWLGKDRTSDNAKVA